MRCDNADRILGKEMASKASSIFESVREIANVLSIGSKEDLLIDVIKESVWPSLRPSLLHDVLKIYQPELYVQNGRLLTVCRSLEKPVSQPLLAQLLELDKALPPQFQGSDFEKVKRSKPRRAHCFLE